MIIEKKQAQELKASNTVTHAVELEKGKYFFFHSSKVETKQCFSYDGTSTKSIQEATDFCVKARNDIDFFVELNINGYKTEIERLRRNNPIKLVVDGNECYIRNFYGYEKDNENMLTKDAKEKLINGYEKAIELHSKKVRAYAKRFGLSKVKTWTYDAWD